MDREMSILNTVKCKGKMCFRIPFLFTLLNLSVISAFGDDFIFPLKSEGNITFYADVYQFMNTQGGTSIEIGYSVSLGQFFSPQDSVSNPAQFSINIAFLNTNGDTLAGVKEQKSILSDESAKPENTGLFIDLKRFTLSADTVQFVLEIKDPTHDMNGRINRKIVIKDFSQAFSTSDLFFASYVQKITGKSNFEKYGLSAIPNPLRVFTYSEQTQNIYVYFEINNMEFSGTETSSYSVNYTLTDLIGREVALFNRPAIKKNSSNCARFEMIPLKDLDHGLYLLNMNVTDLSTGKNITITRYFEVYKPSQNNNLVLSMTDNDIKMYYEQIKYIATSEEKEIFRSLDMRGKQEFLFNFWRSRDPVPETETNEFMQEHFNRIQYVESKFTGGMNSDMGRVFIQYGPPLDIQRQFSSTQVNKPVEIWYYAIEGKTEFIFVDRSGDGRYALVHSTHPDEYQNNDWKQVIK